MERLMSDTIVDNSLKLGTLNFIEKIRYSYYSYSLMPGERLGKYILERKIAKGGMAEIFLGYIEGEAGFKKRVCIKRILPHLSRDEKFIKMFIDEARIVSQLNHANIVQIYEFNEEAGYYYIVMEYVDGLDLKKIILYLNRTGEYLPENLVAFIASEILKGLHYAHTRTVDGKPLNIIHRDITPHNILISKEGDVKLTDFGVAKASIKLYKTKAEVIKGKLRYLSPEQINQLPLDHRSDLFSLGVVLFEALTGRQLFKGENESEIIKAVIRCEIPDIKKIRTDISDSFIEFIYRLLEKDREKRFQSALEALKFLAGLNIITTTDQLELGELIKKICEEMDKEEATKTLAIEEAVKDSSMTKKELPEVTPADSSTPTRTIHKDEVSGETVKRKDLFDRIANNSGDTVAMKQKEDTWIEFAKTVSMEEISQKSIPEEKFLDKERLNQIDTTAIQIATAPTTIIEEERLKEGRRQRRIPTEYVDRKRKRRKREPNLISILVSTIVVLLLFIIIFLIMILLK